MAAPGLPSRCDERGRARLCRGRDEYHDGRHTSERKERPQARELIASRTGTRRRPQLPSTAPLASTCPAPQSGEPPAFGTAVGGAKRLGEVEFESHPLPSQRLAASNAVQSGVRAPLKGNGAVAYLALNLPNAGKFIAKLIAVQTPQGIQDVESSQTHNEEGRSGRLAATQGGQ